MSPTKKAQPKQTTDPSERPEACLRLVNRLKMVCGIPQLVMLMLVDEGERTGGELATAMGGAPISTTSYRLALLRLAGFIIDRRDGQRVFYSLTDEGQALLQIAEILGAETDIRTQ
jgi:DNA-binding transcriptional ArsR family regulator